MTEQDSAEAEIQGTEPKVVIIDEAQGVYHEITESEALEAEVSELMKMSELLDWAKGRRHGSPKVNDKKRNRAKAKTARASRRANRG